MFINFHEVSFIHECVSYLYVFFDNCKRVLMIYLKKFNCFVKIFYLYLYCESNTTYWYNKSKKKVKCRKTYSS